MFSNVSKLIQYISTIDVLYEHFLTLRSMFSVEFVMSEQLYREVNKIINSVDP